MPIYEYYCRDCDGIFETLRPMRRAAEPASCPVCENDGERSGSGRGVNPGRRRL